MFVCVHGGVYARTCVQAARGADQDTDDGHDNFAACVCSSRSHTPSLIAGIGLLPTPFGGIQAGAMDHGRPCNFPIGSWVCINTRQTEYNDRYWMVVRPDDRSAGPTMAQPHRGPSRMVVQDCTGHQISVRVAAMQSLAVVPFGVPPPEPAVETSMLERFCLQRLLEPSLPWPSLIAGRAACRLDCFFVPSRVAARPPATHDRTMRGFDRHRLAVPVEVLGMVLAIGKC